MYSIRLTKYYDVGNDMQNSCGCIFALLYKHNPLNKILYKFNRTHTFYGKLYKMSRIEEIFVPVRIFWIASSKTLFCIFFKTIALSSRVIKVCSTTIRSILHKHNACLSYEENSNDM